MNLRKIHSTSGLIISVFVGMHLFNHSYSILGPDKHIEVMSILRLVYRNRIIESFLLLAIAIQIYSGLKIFKTKKPFANTYFEKLHIWTGLYLAIFLIIHVSAVLLSRLFLHIDTNFYFGAAGINLFPLNLFFIPYYFLAIISFFGHISAIHYKRMKRNILGMNVFKQSVLILLIGLGFGMFLMFVLSNKFQGFDIPEAYKFLNNPFK